MDADGWPLLRSEPEFAAVRAALREPTHTAGVVVVGEAGVGKTTLARDVTDSLPKVRWVAGTASSRSIRARWVDNTALALIEVTRRRRRGYQLYVATGEHWTLLADVRRYRDVRAAVDRWVRYLEAGGTVEAWASPGA